MKGITAKADGDKRIGEVRIYDEISNNPYWGVSAKVFAEEIASLDRIGSPHSTLNFSDSESVLFNALPIKTDLIFLYINKRLS